MFHGLPQKPGKPVLAGIAADGRPVLAAHGNPVSVLVKRLRRLALPAVFARAACHSGAVLQGTAAHIVQVTNPDPVSISLWHHRLVKLTTPGHAELLNSRSSGDVPGGGRGWLCRSTATSARCRSVVVLLVDGLVSRGVLRRILSSCPVFFSHHAEKTTNTLPHTDSAGRTLGACRRETNHKTFGHGGATVRISAAAGSCDQKGNQLKKGQPA